MRYVAFQTANLIMIEQLKDRVERQDYMLFSILVLSIVLALCGTLYVAWALILRSIKDCCQWFSNKLRNFCCYACNKRNERITTEQAKVSGSVNGASSITSQQPSFTKVFNYTSGSLVTEEMLYRAVYEGDNWVDIQTDQFFQ